MPDESTPASELIPNMFCNIRGFPMVETPKPEAIEYVETYGDLCHGMTVALVRNIGTPERKLSFVLASASEAVRLLDLSVTDPTFKSIRPVGEALYQVLYHATAPDGPILGGGQVRDAASMTEEDEALADIATQFGEQVGGAVIAYVPRYDSADDHGVFALASDRQDARPLMPLPASVSQQTVSQIGRAFALALSEAGKAVGAP